MQGGWGLASLRLSLAVIALGLAPLQAQDSIFFSRSFPGSVPPYFEALVNDNGAVEYREEPGEEPVEAQLSKAEIDKVFGLADSLDKFRMAAVIKKRKVAFTGNKVMRFQSAGATIGEAEFDDTDQPGYREAVTFFVHLAASEQHLFELERTYQFDRLGVNKALLSFHSSYDNGRVISAEQFLPVLKKIQAQGKIIHMARSRAASLVEAIEARK